MTVIALYLIFVGVLAAYRSSKYWPHPNMIPWWGKPWWIWGGILTGTTLLLVDKGWTIGALLSLCAYMTFFSGIIFFVNCGTRVRLTVFILFHAACILGLILKF